MELTVLEIIGTLGGAGAVIALVIFYFYRKDRQDYEKRLREDREWYEEKLRADRIFMEDRLTKIIRADQKTRQSNTKALTGLNIYLHTLNGKTKAGGSADGR